MPVRPSSPPSPAPSPPQVYTTFPLRRPSVPIVPAVARAPDGLARDLELEKRWAAVKDRLSRHQASMQNAQRICPNQREWVDVYSEVAKLFQENDATRKRRIYVYVRQFVKDLVASQRCVLQNLPKTAFLLKEYCRIWKATMAFVSYMKRVLHHLHRFWIPDNVNTLKNDPVRPVDNLLMFYWREDLLSEMPQVIEIALGLVDQDRRGLPVDYSLIRGVVNTLVEIGAADVVSPRQDSSDEQGFTTLPTLHLYIRVFEEEFLALTETFYKAEGEKMVEVGDATQFTKIVLARLEEEAERGRRLLHPDSVPRLCKATEQQLIGNHLAYLQDKAIAMVKEGREDDLKLIFTLLKRVADGLPPLRAFFVGFIRAEGSLVVNQHVDKVSGKQDMQSNLELVRVLIRLYRKHATLITRCFDGAQTIMTAIDDAFRSFTNSPLGNICLPNLIAHYVDQVLRQGEKFDRAMWDTKRDEAAPTAKRRKLNADSDVGAKPSTSGAGISLKTLPPVEVGSVPRDSDISIDIERENTESSLLQYLAELVRLFMYLEEKDKFFDTHRRLFAKRLMSHHDEHLETSFISMIKEQMGQFYTQRLSGMLQDKLASNTMQKAFQKYLVERRVECRKRKEEVLVPFTVRILEEDPITPADSILERGGLEGMADRLLGTSLARATLPTHSSADTGAIVPSDANPAIGFSMLLNVANSHTEKGRAEQRERNVKSIDENILKFEEALGIDFNAHVLNALHWPSVEVAKLRLPPLLLACQELFSDFYMRDKETRKLSWIHALSVVNLVGTFSGMGYTFVVSTFQACILLLFNDSDRIRVVDARKMLNLSLEQLCHHIKPLLVSRKCRVLRLERRPANETTETFATVNRPNEKSKMNSTKIYPIPNSGRLSFAPQVMQCQAVSDDSGRPATDVLAPKSSEANTYHEGGPERTADGDRAQSTEARSIAIGPDANQGDGNESESFVNTTHPAPPGATAPAQVQQAKEGTASASEINTGSVEPRGESAKEGESDSPKNTQTERSQADARFMQEGDILHINLGFKSRLHRVVVPASIPKVASANTTTSKKHVVVDRSTRVDAVLVKIMKTKKELTHAALNNLVVEALAPTFLPDPRLIKKRLERLIEQEYVERDKDDPRLYRYAS